MFLFIRRTIFTNIADAAIKVADFFSITKLSELRILNLHTMKMRVLSPESTIFIHLEKSPPSFSIYDWKR